MLDDEAPRRYDPVQWEGEDRFLIPGLSVRLRIVIERHCERAEDDGSGVISARSATRRESAHEKR